VVSRVFSVGFRWSGEIEAERYEGEDEKDKSNQPFSLRLNPDPHHHQRACPLTLVASIDIGHSSCTRQLVSLGGWQCLTRRHDTD